MSGIRRQVTLSQCLQKDGSPHLRERLQVPFNAAPHHHHLLRLEPRLPGYTRLGLGHLVQQRRRPLATDPPRAVPEYRGRIEEGWWVAGC